MASRYPNIKPKMLDVVQVGDVTYTQYSHVTSTSQSQQVTTEDRKKKHRDPECMRHNELTDQDQQMSTEDRKRKHRDTERMRHNELTDLMNQINHYVPGRLAGKETQVNYLKRGARYADYLNSIMELEDDEFKKIANDDTKILSDIHKAAAERVEQLYSCENVRNELSKMKIPRKMKKQPETKKETVSVDTTTTAQFLLESLSGSFDTQYPVSMFDLLMPSLEGM